MFLKIKFKNTLFVCAVSLLSTCSICESKLEIPKQIKLSAKKDEAFYVYLNSIVESVRNIHIASYSKEELVEKAIEGFLANLDPHTSYLNERAYKALQSQTSGEFGGIGIQIAIDNGCILVIAPLDDTPAYKSGIKSGDYILCIDDEYINGISSEEVVEKLRGKPGSNVKLKINRKGKDPFDLVLTRSIIKVDSVKVEILDNIAYVRISSFDKNTTKILHEFFKKYKKELGDKLEGIILDMRDNAGGLLDESVNVADTFLSKGNIVTTKGRDPAHIMTFSAKPNNFFSDLPIVVLVNHGTASAPEIVAGALQDNNRAIIVGIRTFGKGSVQQVIPLSENTGLKVTVAMHYTPSGKCIQGKGITPDIEVNPALIKEIKNFVAFREENIKRSLSKDEKLDLILEHEAKRLKEENEDKKDKTLENFIELIKKTFSSDKHAGKNNEEIKKKLNELSKNKKAKDEDEDDVELLYRTIPLAERKEKDLQLRTAFTVLKTCNFLNKKRVEK